MQLSERQQEIIDEFHFFESWMDKYQYLIDLGKELAPLNPSEMNDANLVRGCQSNVWMLTEGDADNMIIRATSDAAIVSGLIALVIRLSQILSGRLACRSTCRQLALMDWLQC